MTLKITIDVNRCIGSGNCVLNAPDTFDVDDSGTATVVGPATNEDAVRRAVEYCPTSAISVTED